MKKTIMFLGVLSIGFTYAQQGNVGINTDQPKATLEIQPSATNLAGTTNEGIVAPKLSKTRVASTAEPVEGTLVYVTDEATSTIASYTGNDVKVAKIDEKGYYFFNGTEWVKTSNEWLYDETTKRINLKRSGGANMSNSSIFYNKNGAYINSNMLNEISSFFNVNTSAIENRLPITYDKLANNLLVKKVTPETYMELNSAGNTYSLMVHENFTYVADTKDEGKAINMTSQSSTIEVAPANNKNYNLLRGVLNRATHYGSGEAKYIAGTVSDGRLERGRSTGYVYGGVFTSSYSTDQSSNLQVGTRVNNQVLKTGGGKITTMRGADIYSSILNDNQLLITNLNGVDVHNNIKPKGNLTITNAIGISYQGLDIAKTTNTTVTNNYGLKIGNIKGATASNYAIYTGLGKVHLGDEVEIKGSIKVASTTTNDTCDSSKAGTIRFKDKKFQGCTGTEWVDLH